MTIVACLFYVSYVTLVPRLLTLKHSLGCVLDENWTCNDLASAVFPPSKIYSSLLSCSVCVEAAIEHSPPTLRGSGTSSNVSADTNKSAPQIPVLFAFSYVSDT